MKTKPKFIFKDFAIIALNGGHAGLLLRALSHYGVDKVSELCQSGFMGVGSLETRGVVCIGIILTYSLKSSSNTNVWTVGISRNAVWVPRVTAVTPVVASSFVVHGTEFRANAQLRKAL